MRLMESIVYDDNKEGFKDIINKLISDCQPYLKDVLGGKVIHFMLSGRKSDKTIFMGNVRSDRRPTDTHIEIHNDLDVLFSKVFGYPARRNSIFCTGNKMAAEEYGSPYFIFPHGKFKTLYSEKIGDLYIHLFRASYQPIKHENGLKMTFVNKCEVEIGANDRRFAEYHKESGSGLSYDEFYHLHYLKYINDKEKEVEECGQSKYNQFLEDVVRSYIKNRTVDAINSTSEIMLTCKKYWAVKSEGYIYQRLVSYLKEFGVKGHKTDEEYNAWYDTKLDRNVR